MDNIITLKELSPKKNDKLDNDRIIKNFYDKIMRFIEPNEETITEDKVNLDEFLIDEID